MLEVSDILLGLRVARLDMSWHAGAVQIREINVKLVVVLVVPNQENNLPKLPQLGFATSPSGSTSPNLTRPYH
jgi:hypothetical protein